MNYYQLRRERLLKKLPEHSLLILSSSVKAPVSIGMEYPYFINQNFYYLTGISQDNCLLFLLKEKGNKEFLFIDATDELKEKWFGKKLNTNDARKLSNIKEIYDREKFLLILEKIVKNVKNLYLDYHHIASGNLDIKKLFSNNCIHDIYPTIVRMRMQKDPYELRMIVEAIKITHLGLKRIVKELKTAHYEYELYNAFNHEILNHGTHEIAFPTILANEVNACCLHYATPVSTIKPNSLVLCDVGAAFQHYSSDISRTYPVNGHFTSFQKKIYQIVLDCNKNAIKYVKPGITMSSLKKYAKDFLANACLKAKLIKKPEEIVKYYYHAVSHPLGLCVHDDLVDEDFVLKPGMVITIEPGLYIKEKKIGIRIEDDVLVTKTGSRCLSQAIEKEVKDIEKLFGGKK